MKLLVIYEFKKLWSRTTIVSIVALVVFSTVLNTITFLNSSTAFTSKGEKVTGVTSYRTIKNESDNLVGTIDQVYLDNLVNQYHNSIAKKELGKDIRAYSTKYTHINSFINYAKLGAKMTYPTLALEEQLNEEEFYEQFKHSMYEDIKYMNQNNWFSYTDQHMEKINNKIDDLDSTFSTGYIAGFSTFLWKYNEQFLFMLLVIGIALSSLFSKDSNNGVTELSLSSKLGRRANMNSRILAGNLTATIIYLIFTLVLLLEIGIVASFQGFNLSIQNIWLSSTYNISIGSGFLIMLGYGYLVSIVVANLVMLVSIKIKYHMVSAIVSVGGIWFLNGYRSNSFLAQFNPIGAIKNFSSTRQNAFNIYYFLGDIVIPYTVALLGIMVIYLIVIRWVTVLHYRKYKLD